MRGLLTGEPKVAALGLEDYITLDLAKRLEAHAKRLDAKSPDELAEWKARVRGVGGAYEGRCDFRKIAGIESKFWASSKTMCADGKTLWDWFDYVAQQAASPRRSNGATEILATTRCGWSIAALISARLGAVDPASLWRICSRNI